MFRRPPKQTHRLSCYSNANLLFIPVLLVLVFAGVGTVIGQELSTTQPTWSRLDHTDKEPQNWLTYFGNNRAWSYSTLGQITRTNVKNLAPVWTFAAGDVEKGLVATPLVMDGVMYLGTGSDHVFALDAVTGRQLWSYSHPLPDGWVPQVDKADRGVAMGYGLIYLGTKDNHLVALDQKTGREVWDVEVEDVRVCECNISSPPIVVRDKVVVGVTGGEVPHRGYLNAFDAKTGKHVWRFFTVPGPGDPNFGTWGGDAWKMGGGPTWFLGSYDSELNLVYWGVGNAASDYYGEDRRGTNLYTCSVVAVDADTGKLKWYFQETPHDVYDYDSAYEPVLLDIERNGKKEKIVLHPSKNGYAYVLDRETGKFIDAWPYIDSINWTKGIDKNGRPIDAVVPPAGQSAVQCPSGFGARSYDHSAYSPRTGWWYNVGIEVCALITPHKEEPEQGRPWNATEGPDRRLAPPGGGPMWGHIDAFDPLTGERHWRVPTKYLESPSLLATAGDLIFGGDMEGSAFALDARTGEKLWSFNTGASVTGASVTYSVNGRQYVAIDSGVGTGVGRRTPNFFPGSKDHLPQTASNLFVFALPQAYNNEAAKQDRSTDAK
jgi:alcohol dehydrogenase (cytochrome c)